MAKRIYALNTGVGLFLDSETGLKMVPGMEIEIDEATAGQRTQIAIRNLALIEVEKPKKTAPETVKPDDKKKDDKTTGDKK